MDTGPSIIHYKKDAQYLKDKLNWPPALIKATMDEFTYSLKLNSGDIFIFTSADYLNDDFVRLNNIKNSDKTFNRGVEIRVSEIDWVADAPHGVLK